MRQDLMTPDGVSVDELRAGGWPPLDGSWFATTDPGLASIAREFAATARLLCDPLTGTVEHPITPYSQLRERESVLRALWSVALYGDGPGLRRCSHPAVTRAVRRTLDHYLQKLTGGRHHL